MTHFTWMWRWPVFARMAKFLRAHFTWMWRWPVFARIAKGLRARRAVSFIELMVAMTILVMCIVPVSTMFSTSGRAVQKSQNLSLAVGLAHRISQHLLAMPFAQINEVPLPGNTIADGPEDGFFNPAENVGPTQATVKKITAAALPGLHGFLRKYEFRYALLVTPVVFGTGDEMKSVCIFISWREAGQDLSYRMYTYIPKV